MIARLRHDVSQAYPDNIKHVSTSDYIIMRNPYPGLKRTIRAQNPILIGRLVVIYYIFPIGVNGLSLL